MGSRALTSRSYDQTTPTCVLTIAQCQRTTTFDELTASPCFRTTASCRVTSAPWLPSTITSKVTATSDIERLTDAGESHPLRYNRASLDEEFDSLISGTQRQADCALAMFVFDGHRTMMSNSMTVRLRRRTVQGSSDKRIS